MMRRLFLMFGLSVLLAGCSFRAGERPYFMEAVESLQAVAIVPADVHVSKKRFFGRGDPLPGLSKRVAARIMETAATELSSRFPRVTRLEPDNLSVPVLAAIAAAQREFAELISAGKMLSSGDSPARLATDLGPLRSAAGVDTLLLVRLEATASQDIVSRQDSRHGKTLAGGQRSRATRACGHGYSPPPMIYLPPTYPSAPPTPPIGAETFAALVNAKTGAVLWFNRYQYFSSDFNEESVPSIVASTLSDIVAQPGNLLAGPETPLELLHREFFACSNLMFEGGSEATDANYLYLDDPDRFRLAAGTKVSVVAVGRNRVTLQTSATDEKLHLSLEYGTSRIRSVPYFRRVLCDEDPLKNLTDDPRIAAAVRDGQIVYGMTKKQVLVARGYPPLHQTSSIDDDVWTYFDGPGVGSIVRFSDDTVAAIESTILP